MKKQTAAFLLAGILLVCGCAAAEKARYLSRDGDKAYHSSHLAMHAGLEDCRICGNYLKVRSRANGNASVIGHVEQADLVRLQEVSGGWARILVLYSAETSPDSYAGLEGWVDAAYVECGCSERTYYAGGVDAVQGGEVMGGGVNLRELPSGSSRSLGKLSRGERVRVLGRYASGGKTFYRVVRTSGQSGFISADYLDVGGSVPAVAHASSRNASPSTSSQRSADRTAGLQDCKGTENVQATTGQLRVREKPNGEIIGHISPDDRILLEELSGNWARITVTQAKSWYEDCWTGLTGWVSAEYLETAASLSTNHKNVEYRVYTKESVLSALKGIELDFSSGAGGWQTNLNIRQDGSFYGIFEDGDMGDYGKEYPNGTLYECRFSGRLSVERQLSDYSWLLHIDKLTIEGTHTQEYIDEGIRHIPSKPYGIEDTDSLILYTPGMPVSELSDDFLSWASMYEAETYLYGFAVYNPVHGYAFR